MSRLEAVNIAKHYQRRDVVSDVSIHLQTGEVVGLLGPNGAGKTTTFYMLVGLVIPDRGTVMLDGQEITRTPMYQRARAGVAYLPQEASVFRKLSVADNILAILETMPLSRSERTERLESLMEELGVAHLASTMGYSLSGGERRRVEVARALAINPRFLLLDEPFAGVDPLAVGEIQSIIRRLQAKGIGILITDHNVKETLDICQRAYILADGRVLAHGDGQTIVNNQQVREMYLGHDYTM
ncbi:MAG: LPS export ABC transporter ATP-binding protein [Magnetococcales bacterium]|nr:LPS export ABC transporter ATP-binding protein [Magnetococcales bacterium]NGZ26790.1 LPS export ABC transporter ATP-binding protein [Magnetococcales bacterium]